MDDFDPNAVAAEFLKHNMDQLMEGARGYFKDAADKVRLMLDRTYTEYLRTLLDKFSRTKSFLLRSESAPLYKFYEPLHLTCGRRALGAPGIRDVLSFATNTVITGSAGSGKSMLVRHLLLDSLRAKLRIPIFVELRQFNRFDGSLPELVQVTLKLYGFTLSAEYVAKAIAAGHFILFLDGYDEVAHEYRERVKNTILDFAKRNDKNATILTGASRVNGPPLCRGQNWPL